MAVGNNIAGQLNISVTCATPITTQFSLVKFVAGGVAPITANTDVPCGVAQETGALGATILVTVEGKTKLKNGASNVSLGDRIGPSATGLATAVVAGTSTGFFVAGHVFQIDSATNANGLVGAIVSCINPPRNA
jgi:hypothetical protein